MDYLKKLEDYISKNTQHAIQKFANEEYKNNGRGIVWFYIKDITQPFKDVFKECRYISSKDFFLSFQNEDSIDILLIKKFIDIYNPSIESIVWIRVEHKDNTNATVFVIRS